MLPATVHFIMEGSCFAYESRGHETEHDRRIHARRSIRLPWYDYASPGAYFVTIVSKNRDCVFGEVDGERVRLNDYGIIIRDEWIRTSIVRPNVVLDEYVIMPNHVHGIIVITDEPRRGVSRYAPTIFRSPSQTIGAIVRGFKSATTKRINQTRNTPGFPVWQRNYYEHIVRTERDMNRIREYIAGNPLRWSWDKENPKPR